MNPFFLRRACASKLRFWLLAHTSATFFCMGLQILGVVLCVLVLCAGNCFAQSIFSPKFSPNFGRYFIAKCIKGELRFCAVSCSLRKVGDPPVFFLSSFLHDDNFHPCFCNSIDEHSYQLWLTTFPFPLFYLLLFASTNFHIRCFRIDKMKRCSTNTINYLHILYVPPTLCRIFARLNLNFIVGLNVAISPFPPQITKKF